MKKMFAAVVGAALSCAAVSALAADLPPRPAPAQAVYAPVFSWTGFYVGANAGYGWGQLNDPTGTSTEKLNGAIVGGQVGYNYQMGNFVLGFEGDGQASWMNKTVSGTVGGIALTVKDELPWFATLRARAGFAFDRHLLYVTGGAAWVNIKTSATALGTTISANDTATAWTVGGGWEWMFVDRWSAKAEYLYVDTGNTTITLFGVPLSGSGHAHIARLGVNYHF